MLENRSWLLIEPPLPLQQALLVRKPTAWSPVRFRHGPWKRLFCDFVCIFRCFKTSCFFVFDLGLKKHQKSRFWTPQSPSKIHPKATQNRCAKNVWYFLVFLLIFIFCYEGQPLILSPWPVFHSFLRLSFFTLCAWFRFENSWKKLPKTSPKQW